MSNLLVMISTDTARSEYIFLFLSLLLYLYTLLYIFIAVDTCLDGIFVYFSYPALIIKLYMQI